MTLGERLEAARTGAAVGPVEDRGVLRLSGKKARDFLQRISTQEVKSMEDGSATYLAFLDARGHLVGEGLLLARSDGFLLVTEPAEAAPLVAHLRKYVLMDDVKVEDLSVSLRCVAVLGPRGTDRVAGLPDAFGSTPRRGVPAVEVVAAPDRAAEIRDALVAGGAAVLSADDMEVLRLEEGVARFGADMDGSRLPMEAGLTRDAIDFKKGCYTGQEVVVRGTIRGQIQKGLVQLLLPAGAGPGTVLFAEGNEVGVVTSAGETTLGRVGLGIVRRAHWKEGERLASPAGEAVVRKVMVTGPAS